MPFFIENKTYCKICKQMIQTANESLVLDYVDVNENPDLIPYVKSMVHRSCFVIWPMKEKYTQAAFDLVKNAQEKGLVAEADYLNSRLGISVNEWEIRLNDFYNAFTIEIKPDDLDIFIKQLHQFLKNELKQFQYKHWKFERIEQHKVIKIIKINNDEIRGEYELTENRIQEIIDGLEFIASTRQ